MTRKAAMLLILLALLRPTESRAGAPHEVAGFTLGGRMADFQDRVEMDTVLPIRYLESIKEVEAKEIIGFKTGLVLYRTCVEPSRIVRLKFKYADPSKRFYQELLKRYKANFGDPDQWRGDPFHIVRAWKWHFTDSNGNRISLILQHNIRDEEEKEGNSVKMTMWDLILDEQRCFEKKNPAAAESEDFTFSDPSGINWDLLIPK